MEPIYIIEIILSIALTIAIFIIILGYWRIKNDGATDSSIKSYFTGKSHHHNSGARDLCIESLKQLNCDVELDEKNKERIHFSFQGEHFFIDITNEYAVFDIWDAYWYDVDLDNITEMSIARKAINIININEENAVVYTIDEDDNQFCIHTKRSCMMFKEMPNPVFYLKTMLESFFVIHRNLLALIDKIKKEENTKVK